MSADLFTRSLSSRRPSNDQLLPQSRIPVISHTPLRRWGSLRASGEKQDITTSKSANQILTASKDVNQSVSLQPPGNNQDTTLRRGNSFMERGERRGINGVRPSAVAPRAQIITTEARSPGALNRATTPQAANRNRSLSLSLSNALLNSSRSPSSGVLPSPPTPPSSPDLRQRSYRDWDLDSVTSTTSGFSVASCDHASVARNGTTFSGRSMKYVVHCSEHAGATGEDYLTPTQRAHRQVKRLKLLLQQASKELELKDSDILKLTKEVVELRLYKAALGSPEDKSNSSSDAAVTVRENNTDEPTSPIAELADCVIGNHVSAEGTSSCTDSGHFEDLTNSSVHSKDSINIGDDINLSPYKSKTPVETADKAITADFGNRDLATEHQRLIVEYERRLQDLVRTHEQECHQMKQKHNDKVEELLQRLTDVNTRYWEVVPDLDLARERIKELEQQLDEACKKLEEQEDKHKQAYLHMYNQGHEAAKLEHEKEVLEIAQTNPSRISVPDLLHQLQVTQNELENVKAMYRQLVEAKSHQSKIDPEMTLQFLKSAIYYFLTDRENNHGHLRAIQSILGFTSNEISNIDKARMT